MFEDALVPAANRLGAKAMATGSRLSSLAEGRISIAAACVGIARSALEQAAAYLRERRAFGASLSEQQGLRFMLAEMARDVEAAPGPDPPGRRRQGPRRFAGRALVARQVDGLRHGDARRRPKRSSCSGRAATRARPASSG